MRKKARSRTNQGIDRCELRPFFQTWNQRDVRIPDLTVWNWTLCLCSYADCKHCNSWVFSAFQWCLYLISHTCLNRLDFAFNKQALTFLCSALFCLGYLPTLLWHSTITLYSLRSVSVGGKKENRSIGLQLSPFLFDLTCKIKWKLKKCSAHQSQSSSAFHSADKNSLCGEIKEWMWN